MFFYMLCKNFSFIEAFLHNINKELEFINVTKIKINASSFSDKRYTARKLAKGKELLDKAKEMERKVLAIVERKISS